TCGKSPLGVNLRVTHGRRPWLLYPHQQHPTCVCPDGERVPYRPYVPSTNEATHPRCYGEGYPDGPGRASNKEGEPWGIIPKLSSESIRQNRVMQWQSPKAAGAERCGFSGSSPPPRRQCASSLPSLGPSTAG